MAVTVVTRVVELSIFLSQVIAGTQAVQIQKYGVSRQNVAVTPTIGEEVLAFVITLSQEDLLHDGGDCCHTCCRTLDLFVASYWKNTISGVRTVELCSERKVTVKVTAI